MFGRAGRRGIDETGFVLVSGNEIRLREAYPGHLSRSGMVDWAALLSLMHGAAEQGREPFLEAVKVQERLFSTKPIFLGVEESLKNPQVPCGLMTDAERARHVRKRVREMLNSRGEWELMPAPGERPLREIKIMQPVEQGARPEFRPVLSEPDALEKVGIGVLTQVGEENGFPIYGRATTVAELLNNDRILLVKWVRRLTRWGGKQAPLQLWNERIVPLLEQKLALQKTPALRLETRGYKIVALVSLADLSMRVPVDSYGVPIWRPPQKEVLPADCSQCALVPVCRQLPTTTGVAMLWRRLGLVDAAGAPTLRGQIVSFFSQSYGLGIAAAIEDESYPLDELIYDLANLDAGFRFAGDENRWAGRIPMACHRIYGLQSIPGYLENGLPPRYGSGAEQILASIHKNPLSKSAWVTEFLGAGDIDRVIIEWRSLLRQISNSPRLELARWQAFQGMARAILHETESPTLAELPPLDYAQTRRMDHRLILRRH
jgi:hypothetical protein